MCMKISSHSYIDEHWRSDASTQYRASNRSLISAVFAMRQNSTFAAVEGVIFPWVVLLAVAESDGSEELDGVGGWEADLIDLHSSRVSVHTLLFMMQGVATKKWVTKVTMYRHKTKAIGYRACDCNAVGEHLQQHPSGRSVWVLQVIEAFSNPIGCPENTTPMPGCKAQW